MIGQQIRKLRKQRGLTQAELGKGLLSVSYISQIESNQKEIPDYLIGELAKRLGVPPDVLNVSKHLELYNKFKAEMNEVLDLIYCNHLNDAEKKIHKLKQDLECGFYHEEIALNFYLIEFMLAIYSKHIPEAELMLKKISDLPYQDYPSLHVRLITSQGQLLAAKKLFKDALEKYIEALQIKTNEENVEIDLAFLHYHIAFSYFQLNDYQNSYDHFNKCIPTFSKLGYWYYLAYSYHYIGGIYFYRSNWQNALENYNKVLKLARELSADKLLAQVLHNLGLVYFQLEDKGQAHMLWQESLKIAESLNDDDVIFPIYNINYAYFKEKDWPKFLETKKIVLEKFKTTKVPILEARFNRTLGHYYRVVEQNPCYLEYYQTSLKKFKEANLYLEAGDVALILAKETDKDEYYRESALLYKQYLDSIKIKVE